MTNAIVRAPAQAMLDFVDRRGDTRAWADSLGVSKEAVDLYVASDPIDLHVDSFIWSRIFAYDLTRRHGHGPFGARFLSQVDFPRILEAGVAGATWAITTNPFRTPKGRARAFFSNLDRLLGTFARVREHFAVVSSAPEYRAARAAKKHAAFIGVQGGNALDADLDDWARIPGGVVTRVTLVHLSSSSLGSTSSPMKFGDRGLTGRGRELVERLEHEHILVDLAHISGRGFFDVVRVHDKTKPLIVTHTGVTGVYRHWRNLDDDQLRAVAESGGTVGVIYQSNYLGGPFWGCAASLVADHVAHVVRTVGDDHVSLGSDWDGLIVTPRDLATCLELPRLVQILLDRGFSDVTVRKILGENFLRTLAAVRP